MFSERTSVGLDVHARSVVAVAIDGVSGEVFKTRLSPTTGTSCRGFKTFPGRWRSRMRRARHVSGCTAR